MYVNLEQWCLNELPLIMVDMPIMTNNTYSDISACFATKRDSGRKHIQVIP